MTLAVIAIRAFGAIRARRPRAVEPPAIAVLLVHVLDRPLAAIAARQIEIDVRPLAALFREKPLEQQIHPDRIDRGDAEAVAHGAVGRRAASLHEDVLLPAVIDDVPDDQEIAGEIELLDQIELALDLSAARDRRYGRYRSRAPACVIFRRNDGIVSPAGTG